ncbi:COG4315 family predicted lipoprotein [Haladaptatus sp. DFWS20]|uniref:COG4315 family predicted lipoprotein n=1 Tax=Haladaptatus sp. DFWS20 TaxID=3403467 RepID=UPI003EB6ACB6
MNRTRRSLLGAIAATTVLAGCLGGGDGGSDTTTDTTMTETTMSDTSTTITETTTTDGKGGMTVQVRQHSDLGDILVGPEGKTLYMFDSDTKGEQASTCSDGCAKAWPPLTVSKSPTKSDAVTASITTFERESGEMQVAANGWPLYYFASDENPGDVNGQGVNDVWWVLEPDGNPVKPSSTTSADGGY